MAICKAVVVEAVRRLFATYVVERLFFLLIHKVSIALVGSALGNVDQNLEWLFPLIKLQPFDVLDIAHSVMWCERSVHLAVCLRVTSILDKLKWFVNGFAVNVFAKLWLSEFAHQIGAWNVMHKYANQQRFPIPGPHRDLK